MIRKEEKQILVLICASNTCLDYSPNYCLISVNYLKKTKR